MSDDYERDRDGGDGNSNRGRWGPSDETPKIFVGNVSYYTTERELRKEFEEFGEIVTIAVSAQRHVRPAYSGGVPSAAMISSIAAMALRLRQ